MTQAYHKKLYKEKSGFKRFLLSILEYCFKMVSPYFILTRAYECYYFLSKFTDVTEKNRPGSFYLNCWRFLIQSPAQWKPFKAS